MAGPKRTSTKGKQRATTSSSRSSPSPPPPQPKNWNFFSTQPRQLGNFVRDIHSQPIAIKERLPTKVLSFLTHDNLPTSGIAELLAPHLVSRAAYGTRSDSLSPAELKWDHIARDGCTLYDLCRNAEQFGDPWDLPVGRVFGLYCYLLSICSEVETIEIPAEWEASGVVLRDDYFPRVDRGSRTVLDGGRVRWGRPPREDEKPRELGGCEAEVVPGLFEEHSVDGSRIGERSTWFG